MGETTLMCPGRLDILCLLVGIICLLLFEGCTGTSVVQMTQAGLLSCFLQLQEGLGRTISLFSWVLAGRHEDRLPACFSGPQ